MKKLLFLFGVLILAASAQAQSSGSTAPPPPVCSASNAGTVYTQTSTTPNTVYTCSYYNLQYQWIVNPSYGGLVYYPTVPTTCSGALPMFVAGYPATTVYVCVQGKPTAVAGSATLQVATTPITGGTNGYCLTDDNGVLGSAVCGGASFPTGTTNQLLYYQSSGQTVSPLTLGSALDIASGTLNAAPTGVTPGQYTIGGQVMNVNSSGQITALGNPFTATFTCTQCGTYENGYSITSASGTISYANPSTPTSASVGDGTSTDTLASPFTSWTLGYTYTTNTTFTLTAVGDGQTVTHTASITFLPRVFGGVGTAGATGATASGSSAALSGATGTLASNGLSSQSTWGPYTANNQKVYVLSLGASCSFTSGGFAFPMLSPTTVAFTNQYGSVVSMYLYESANLLSSSVTLQGAC